MKILIPYTTELIKNNLGDSESFQHGKHEVNLKDCKNFVYAFGEKTEKKKPTHRP